MIRSPKARLSPIRNKSGTSTWRKKLSAAAKGRAYFCENGQSIPQIFQADTGAAAKLGITEEPFFPQVVHSSKALSGLDMAHAPALLGYVETIARPEANVVLAAKTGE